MASSLWAPEDKKTFAGMFKQSASQIFGTLTSVNGVAITIEGMKSYVGLGDVVEIDNLGNGYIRGEVVSVADTHATALTESSLLGVSAGAKVLLVKGENKLYPDDAWLGHTIDSRIRSVSGDPLRRGPISYPLQGLPPTAAERRLLGARAPTGYAAIDTMLPLCFGQRLGVFAGSGVGKSTFLAGLADRAAHDVVIIALIGERGREVRSFVEEALTENARARSAVFVATADESPLLKRRAAHAAMATAEKFRDDGRQVLVIFDSLTRYAEAHREIALSAGEAPSLNGFPPSTVRALAGLVERAGPGARDAGDISAVFSVLVAGSDMEEPLADMLRGILDGHVVLDRRIAERGRFPAINVLRSVSRSMPKAATDQQNAVIGKARAILQTFEESELMVRAGLYEKGSDARVDEALRIYPALDKFIGEFTQPSSDNAIDAAFAKLSEIVAPEANSDATAHD